MPHEKTTEYLIVIVVPAVVIAIGAAIWAWSGLYNIGADDHHWNVTYNALQTVRDRSIHVRSEHIKVPNLNDPQLILKGAGQYAAMCTGCHLRPGSHTHSHGESEHHIDHPTPASNMSAMPGMAPPASSPVHTGGSNH